MKIKQMFVKERMEKKPVFLGFKKKVLESREYIMKVDAEGDRHGYTGGEILRCTNDNSTWFVVGAGLGFFTCLSVTSPQEEIMLKNGDKIHLIHVGTAHKEREDCL